MKSRRIVVTGLGTIASGAIGLASFWQRVTQGPPAGALIQRFDVSSYQSQIAAEVENFDGADYGLTAEQCQVLDRSSQFALVAAIMAAQDAGRLNDVDLERTGVCIGTAIGGIEIMDYGFARTFVPGASLNKRARQLLPSKHHFPPSMFYSFMPNTSAIEIAAHFSFSGPCTTISTGCTAGTDAIGYAYDLIQRGDSDVMLCGGTDAPITPITLAAFDNIKAISRRSIDPEHASRPFDRDRDGFLLAEGCAVIVLEELEHALKRGASIYAELCGYGSACNAYHMTGLPEDGIDLARTMELALADAGIDSRQIGYINAHGSSTLQNDINETNAIKSVFKKRAYAIPISSTKSVIGHPLGAAGALECAATILAVNHQFLPPTFNYQTADPVCDLDYLPNKGRVAQVEYALSNSSGFSGLHSTLIIGRI